MRIDKGTRDQRRARGGFTLAEVMVAVGVLSVSFVSLYLGISSGFALTRVSRENLRATQIMMEKMEGVRLYNWNQLTLSNMIPRTFEERYYPQVGGHRAEGVTYHGTITVTNPASMKFEPKRSYDNNTRVVIVEVNWTSGDVVRTRRMNTLVSKNGLQNYVYDR